MKVRILSAMLAFSIITGGAAAFAERLGKKEVIKPLEVEANHEELFDILELNTYIKNDTTMLPLRKVGERLGYTIEWNEILEQVDISKDGLTTSIKSGKNVYFIGQEPPIELSNAPDIKKGTTYVPLEFFGKVLGEDLLFSGKNLVLLTSHIEEEIEEMELEGYIKDVIESEDSTSILVSVTESEMNLNEIILHLYEDSEFYHGEEEIELKDIKVGNKVRAITPKFMTMSIPAQTTGEKIFIDEFIEIKKSGNEDVRFPEIKESIDRVSASFFNQAVDNFIQSLENTDIYKDLDLDYQIKLLNEEKISIIFRGSYDFMGERKDLIRTLNLDFEEGQEITFENYFKNDDSSQRQLKRILSAKVKEQYGKEFEAEEMFIYFPGNDVILYYYEKDDPYNIPTEIYLEEETIEGLVNEAFLR